MATRDPIPTTGGGDTEPELGEVIRELDAADDVLMMAYARYMDFASDKRLKVIHTATDEFVMAFGDYLRKMIQSKDDRSLGTRVQRVSQIATVIMGYENQHNSLIADYDGPVKPYKGEDIEEKRRDIINCLIEQGDPDDDKELTAHILSHFMEIIETDWEAIESTVEAKQNEPLYRAARFGGEVVKLTITAALGAAIANKLRKN